MLFYDLVCSDQQSKPNWAAMPVGFALDVALDPVNWFTAGSNAFIPRVGKGLVKTGVSGL